jgi:hypothetical protein
VLWFVIAHGISQRRFISKNRNLSDEAFWLAFDEKLTKIRESGERAATE